MLVILILTSFLIINLKDVTNQFLDLELIQNNYAEFFNFAQFLNHKYYEH